MANYHDVQELGRGGFGVVHKCTRTPDGALFAKKTLLLDDMGSIKRFQREVRIIQKLNHHGIVSESILKWEGDRGSGTTMQAERSQSPCGSGY